MSSPQEMPCTLFKDSGIYWSISTNRMRFLVRYCSASVTATVCNKAYD